MRTFGHAGTRAGSSGLRVSVSILLRSGSSCIVDSQAGWRGSYVARPTWGPRDFAS